MPTRADAAVLEKRILNRIWNTAACLNWNANWVTSPVFAPQWTRNNLKKASFYFGVGDFELVSVEITAGADSFDPYFITSDWFKSISDKEGPSGLTVNNGNCFYDKCYEKRGLMMTHWSRPNSLQRRNRSYLWRVIHGNRFIQLNLFYAVQDAMIERSGSISFQTAFMLEEFSDFASYLAKYLSTYSCLLLCSYEFFRSLDYTHLSNFSVVNCRLVTYYRCDCSRKSWSVSLPCGQTTKDAEADYVQPWKNHGTTVIKLILLFRN